MKTIRILEPQVSNMIAAGEVVERPASIVKELVENSIDAGSTAITIEIRNGGVPYIRLTDNGSGISTEDIETAFLPHATSKLRNADDLLHIETLGFRGEALASIAAVACISMRTRQTDEDIGSRIVIEGGKESILEPCGCPPGTTIEVTDLFFNVPARLKFLKSAASEAALIGDYVSRLILSNTNIAIKFINNGRTVYHSAGDGKLNNALFCVYGGEISSQLYPVSFDDGYMKLEGYVGSETLAQSTRIKQSFFINGRYVKSPIVSSSVQRAYDTRLMHGKFPFFVLNMRLSSYEIDVNVHPNKLAIRFKDEERVSLSTLNAVRSALSGKNDFKAYPDIAVSNGEKTRTEDISLPRDAYSAFSKKSNGSEVNHYSDRAMKNGNTLSDDCSTDVGRLADTVLSDISVKKKTGKLEFRDSGVPEPMPSFEYTAVDNTSFEISSVANPQENDRYGFPVISVATTERAQHVVPMKAEQIEFGSAPYTVVGVAFDTYIIVQQGDALYYIDQHAAHERMLYEKLINGKLRFESQILITPDVITLDPVSHQILVSNMDRFNEMGFTICTVNDTVIKVSAVPMFLKSNYSGFFTDAVELLRTIGKIDETDLLRSELTTAACKKAVKAGDRLEAEEIESILSAYASGDIPLTCPHGRPVIIKVTKTELQKLFKRIV